MEKEVLILLFCILLCFSCKEDTHRNYKNEVNSTIRDFIRTHSTNKDSIFECYVEYQKNFANISIVKSSKPIYVQFDFKMDTIKNNLILFYNNDTLKNSVFYKNYINTGAITLNPDKGRNLDGFSQSYIIIYCYNKQKYIFEQSDFYSRTQNVNTIDSLCKCRL